MFGHIIGDALTGLRYLIRDSEVYVEDALIRMMIC